MKTEITGNFLPVLSCVLEKGEKICTESGGMSWMSDSFEMTTNTNGGVMKGIGRAFAGESIFMNTYTCTEEQGEIAFASCFPGQILEFDISEGQSLICQKGSFLCGESEVKSEMFFRKKIGAGFFGGEGFIMQKITGHGKAFLEIDGNVTKKELKDGEILKIDNGYVVAMTDKVDLDIITVKGVKNMFFGGEGMFLTTLKGPGSVWLQSMPISKLASTLSRYLPTSSN
ncbi:MAG: TIGR00266 family protein [Clostridia bacterium]